MVCGKRSRQGNLRVNICKEAVHLRVKFVIVCPRVDICKETVCLQRNRVSTSQSRNRVSAGQYLPRNCVLYVSAEKPFYRDLHRSWEAPRDRERCQTDRTQFMQRSNEDRRRITAILLSADLPFLCDYRNRNQRALLIYPCDLSFKELEPG